MNLKENVTKGKYSNVIGSLIILAAMVSVFVPQLEIDWTQASIGMGVGLTLIGLGNK